MKRVFCAIFSALMCAAAPARDCRPALIPNGDVYDCLTCHRSFGGDVRNAFGLDVEAVVIPGGCDPFWDNALALKDSDGDGYSNGQELGDFFGRWYYPLAYPGSPLRVSHPAEATSTPSFGPIMLNEVLAATPTGQALELRNNTLLPRNLTGGWIAAEPGDASFALPAGLVVPASGLVVVHWNTIGVDQIDGATVQHVYTGAGLAALDGVAGCLALFRDGNFTSAASLAAFLQYGLGSQAYSGLAVQRGLWPAAGDYAEAGSWGESLEYDGEGFAPAAWRRTPMPTLGAENHPAPNAVPRGLWR